MNILFVSYWGIEEGLTQATVIPHVRILAEFERVSQVILCTIERGPFRPLPSEKKILHVPLVASQSHSVLWNKVREFTRFRRKIFEVCSEYRISFIIARSALAGGLCIKAIDRLKIPYLVESFEPHALYMIESGVWNKTDPRFWVESYLEKKQKRTARFLLPVSDYYATVLQSEGVAEDRLHVMPCCVDVDSFSFNRIDRNRIRVSLSIPDKCVVGIYAGKYGGMYYCDEAFQLYRQAFDFFGGTFHLIILSGDDHQLIHSLIKKYGLPIDRIHLYKVSRDEVVAYLSAADFAFATYKPSYSKKFLSPIKIGEYWANGLPVVLEKGIGEESDIIANEGGGIILDRQDTTAALSKLERMLSKGRERLAEEIHLIALKYRSLSRVKETYLKLIVENGR